MVLSASPAGSTRRATVVGTGLIGGSIGMALRTRGWHVSGVDLDEATLATALDMGAMDRIGCLSCTGEENYRD